MPSLWQNDGALTEQDISLIESGLNLIQQGVTIYDSNLELVAWNRRFVEIYSLPNGLVKRGSTFEDVVKFLATKGEYGPGDIDKLVEERVNRARMFEPHYLERKRPNGTSIAVEGHPLKNGGWVAVYTDVTAQKNQEELLKERSEFLSDRLLQDSARLSETNRQLLAANRALEEVKYALTASEDRLQVINKSLPAHIAYLDRNLVYRFSNLRLPEIWGIPKNNAKKEVVGEKMEDIFPNDIFTYLKPFLEQSLGGETISTEYDNPTETQPDHAVRVIFTPEKNQKGEVIGLFVLSTDITDQRKVANSIINAQRLEAVTQLTGGLAHDLNNILTIVLGNLSRLHEQLGDSEDDDAENTIISTKKAARRAARIMESLVAFSRRRALEPRATNVSRVLRELYGLAVPNLPPSIQLKLQMPDASMTAFIDESAFQDAVINLLFNARDALPGGYGEIEITLKAEQPDSLIVTISDNGHGFDDEMLENAYQPFFTTKERGAGTGLGLSMVQGFALQSGGDIWIESELGKGAQVHLKLPAMNIGQEDIVIKEDKDVSTLKISSTIGPILVVEDQADIRENIRYVLRNADLTIIEAASGAEALEILNVVEEIELVISDITMPGSINGLDLARTTKKILPDMKIILMSGLAETDQIWCDAVKEFETLRKPFDNTKLLNTIHQSLTN
jgi:signal transduction histidine kinase/CheY-like chemotaxis protein